MKTLYFEGAGCFNVSEYLDPEFRGNPRIRTAFRNDKGAAIYLELICGAIRLVQRLMLLKFYRRCLGIMSFQADPQITEWLVTDR